jgi:hypothetical protein
MVQNYSITLMEEFAMIIIIAINENDKSSI